MNFIEAQKILVKILNNFGFFAFKVKNCGKAVGSEKFQVFYSIFINTLNQIIFIGTHIKFVLEVKNYLSDDNQATRLVTILEGIAVEVSSLIIFFGVFWCRKSQKNFLTYLLEMEKRIESFDLENVNQSLMKRSKIEAVSQILLHVALVGMFTFLAPSDQFTLFVIESFNFITFSLYLILITQFVNNTVKTLGNLFDEVEKKIEFCVTFCPFHFGDKNLLNLLKIHENLTESIEIFNESFGVIVFGVFVYISGIISAELYYGFALIFGNSNAVLNFNLVINISGNIFTVFPILFTFCNFGFTCEEVQEKVSKLRGEN